MVLSRKGQIQTAFERGDSASPHQAVYSLLFHMWCVYKDMKISQYCVHLLILHILILLFHQALDQRFSLCAGVKGVYK